ncbi:unnamed protein product, partial [Symbiodinium microadriaticum]
ALEEKARDEKAHASDSSEEMIAGEAAPTSRTSSPQRHSEPASAASAGTKRKAEEAQDEAQTGTKRTAEEAQGEAQTSTKLTHEEAQREAQTSTKRTHEEADLADDSQPMSIRRVGTVDAEWYTGDATQMATEDNEENDPHDKHIVTGDADQPPTLEAHVLRDYDYQAEVEEIELLIQMGVLVEPVRGATFATIWKGDKGTWWRRARLVARQYTDGPPTGGRGYVFSSRYWVPFEADCGFVANLGGTPIWVCDVKDAYLNVEQPKDAPVVVDAPLSYARRYGPKRWKLGRILPGQRRGAQEWFLHMKVDLEAQGLLRP